MLRSQHTLNALYLYSILENPFLFFFVPPIASANDQVYNYHASYLEDKRIWEDFQQMNEGKVTGELSEEIKSRIEGIALMKWVDRHNSYFLSIQAKFEGLPIQGKTLRPDLFIWIGSKPEFKLVVECDGYSYHSDESASTKDRARDRLLQSYGFQVFRFSGYEIVHNPLDTAQELYQYLVAKRNTI